jgi:gliding motility-associated-like protein
MSKSILGLILALFLSLQARAEQPTFNISSTDANPGQIIDVNFNVDNFSQLISVQFSVNWDPAVLQFRTIKNFNPSVPGLSPAVFGATPAMTDDGYFTLGWIESSITPITIPDGSLFFTVEFEVIGAPCDNSPVAITNTPLEIEVAEDDENVGLIANNGAVNVPGTGCTENINIIGNSITGVCGGNACIQFTVENFQNVGVMQFSLVYNPAILQFDEFRNFASLTSFNAGSTNLVAPGELRIVWTNSNVENETLPDGTVLFEICFDVIGTGGQSSTISLGPSFPVLFSDIDGNEHEVNLTPAVITAQCQLEGFALITDTVCTMPNGLACFDVKINDFDDIIALQFSMNWDSNLFVFDHVEGFGIPGLDESGFGVPANPDVEEGELTVAWIDLSLEGVTLPDLSTIFRLCLKAKGAAGSNSPVTFSANPLDIEVATLDSVLVYGLINGRGEIRQSCEGCDISYTLTAIHPNCPRETNGVLNLTIIENCPETPMYLWSYNNLTTQDLTGIGAGIYTVTVTIGSNIIVVSDTLFDPLPIAVEGNIINPDPISGCNGSINITVTGGTPPYTYQWSTPPGGTTEDLLNILCAGSYTVTVTDNFGCTFIPDEYVVGAEVSAAVTNVSCNGGSDGAINLSVSFGTGPYTYVWNTTPVSTAEDINNLSARQYCVTITDNTGSTRDTCFTVTQPSPLNVTATITHDVNENCGGAIDMNITGGTMPYAYQWSTPPGGTSQDLTQLCAGQYCVTITYGNECTLDTCFNVFAGGIGVVLVATQYGNYQTSCPGVCDGEITSQLVGGGTVTYLWSNGATTADLDNLCAGTYTVTVTDQSGQTATASIVLSAPPPFALAYIKTNPSDYITSDGAISVVVNGGTPPYSYQWTGPATGNTAALNNVPAGTYTVEVTDANGCEIRDSEQLLPDVDVPCYSGISVITPNSDGANDYFIIACILDFENHLYIFNRQGGMVYETDDYQNTWTGVDQDGEALPDGGYLWVLEVIRQDGSKELIKGTVNLLRTAD